MLFPLRSGNLYRPLRRFDTRSLTTLPKPTASYVKIWNPTLHSPSQSQEIPSSLQSDGPDVSEQDERKAERKAERKQLRDTQEVTVVGRSGKGLLYRNAIQRLNRFLRAAQSGKVHPRLRFFQWRAYYLAKNQDPELPSFMPDGAWDLLWNTQATGNRRPETRRQRLEALYLDMHSVGATTTVGQRVAYLESMFLNGKEQQALQEWEQDYNDESKSCSPSPSFQRTSSSRHDYKPQHLEVGAKMYALAGNPDRANEIMQELFGMYPRWDTSVMKTVFRAHTSSQSDKHHDTAQTIYLKLKERLGDKLSLADYDAYFVGFLEARHIHFAKQVFRDMVKDGRIASSFSQEHTKAVLERLHMLYRLGTDIEKMTSIALTAISTLPKAYHTHVFNDWVRQAVVKHAPEAAAQILNMMVNRGLQPLTSHFNLLLKALYRTKDKEHILKAENIGWRMIEEVRRSPEKNIVSAAPDMISEWEPTMQECEPHSEVTKSVPKANVTTFALMMQHYASKLQWEHVEYLTRRLNESGLQPNATLMNIWMDNLCWKGQYSEAWKVYKSLTNAPDGSQGVFPDGSSMRCLWKILRLALGHHATRDDPDLPTPRQLLAETVQWWQLCRRRADADRFRMGIAAVNNGAVTSLMMHCFSYTQDFAGSLVALHAMRKNFTIFPSDTAATILQKQAAWVDMHRDTQSVRSQYHRAKVNEKNLDKLGRIYYILMEKRFKRLNITGDQYAHMSEEEVGDFGLNLLSEFVRVILKRSYPLEAVEAMIDEAKKEVGLPDMATGDMDAYSVA